MLNSAPREREDRRVPFGFLVSGWGQRFVWSRPRKGVNVLLAYEARRDTMVRVREGHWKTKFAGMCGTLQKCWAESEYAAVVVMFEDGHTELFWLPNLDVVDEDAAA